MQFLDTHHHLILRDRLGYAWTDTIPALAGRNFTLDNYTDDSRGQVHSAIFMETGVDDSDYKAEARMAAELIGLGRFLGQIASCRPEAPDFGEWLDECESLGVVAYRRILHVVPDAFSEKRKFRESLSEIQRRGLPFELCLRPDQLEISVTLARAFPELQFILNHCGNPDIAAEGFRPWARDIAGLAENPNVAVKLSGITANARADQQNDETLFPYMSHVVEVFGADRVVWGSDWPACNQGMGLERWILICNRFFAHLSEDERRSIATDTARRIYHV